MNLLTWWRRTFKEFHKKSQSIDNVDSAADDRLPSSSSTHRHFNQTDKVVDGGGGEQTQLVLETNQSSEFMITTKVEETTPLNGGCCIASQPELLADETYKLTPAEQQQISQRKVSHEKKRSSVGLVFDSVCFCWSFEFVGE